MRTNFISSDTRITLERTHSFDCGYGGGSSYFSNESFLGVLPRASLPLPEIGFSRTSYGRMSVGESTRSESQGEWKIQVSGGTATLVLTGDSGVDYYRD